MIVCSCNVLSDTQILSAIESESLARPSTPAAVYRCLGCAPRCGRCVATIRALLDKANVACHVGCAVCPAHDALEPQAEPQAHPEFGIAAE